MKLTLRGKIAFISIAIMVLAMGATILVNSRMFAKEYSDALHLKTLVIAQTLRSQLDRLLKLKIPLSELVGFEEQCQDVLSRYQEIAYAMVVDLDGTILFHNDPMQHGQVETEPGILKDIKNQQGASHVYFRKGTSFYNTVVPIFNSREEHIAAVMLGLPTDYIMQKTRTTVVYSSEVAAAFIVLAVLLLIFFLNLWVSRPLNQLMTVIRNIRQQGSITVEPVRIHSSDEIGQLSLAFHQMMSELQESQNRVKHYTQELKTLNTQLQQDILKRMRTEEDLTRTYHELKNTQAQLIQSGKLASIGELAAGVAHELNQPLMVIYTTIQFIQRSFKKGNLKMEHVVKQCEPLERNSKRMMTIINHLRTFSRQSQPEFSPLDVNTIIENAFLMIKEQLRLHSIDVKQNLSPDLPKILGHTNQLEQVVLNLLTNARDAIEAKGSKEPGQIEITTRVCDDNTECVEILIEDSGNGILGNHMEKMFDPFFTTKEVGKGTGLGLSISYGIIQDHQGYIGVAETGPKGTTIRIKLPAVGD